MIEVAAAMVKQIIQDHDKAKELAAEERRLACAHLRNCLAEGNLSPSRRRMMEAELRDLERKA